MTWSVAFILTLLIELIFGRFVWREVEWKRFAVVVLVASTLTHPVVWFVLPSLAEACGWSYSLYVLLAELYAYTLEVIWYWTMGVPRPYLLSLVANGASCATGWAIYSVLV